MDKLVEIRIVRTSDNTEFLIGQKKDWWLLKNGLDGWGGFDNDIESVDNATRDGGVFTSTRLGIKNRGIKCAYMYPRTNDVAREQALKFFNARSTYKVYMTYGSRTLWAEGIIKKFYMDNYADVEKRLDLTLLFSFENPYLKSYDDFGKDIASVKGLIGFPYISNISDGFMKGTSGGIFNFAQQVILSNDGDIEARCRAVFRASGTVVNPKLVINDAYVRVLDTMQDGDVITMDFAANPPTVKKNGVNFIGQCDRTSKFNSMILGIGDTAVQYTADDGTNLLSVSIYYNKLYTAI